MSPVCDLPEAGIGVAIQLSAYLDCQARALGENGFQALVGGTISSGLLVGLVTLFVASIGYRLLLGERLAARDGIGWAIRLGIVLALAAGWPAFQTLFYRVAIDGPDELAQVVLPSVGLSSEALDQRVQAAYDTIRLGGTAAAIQLSLPSTTSGAAGQDLAAGTSAGVAVPETSGLGPGQTPRPITALLLVVSTIGLTAAFRIAVGFLLAIGPLSILALLFEATAGLFAGWAATLAGAALAVLATTAVTALELVMVEGEIGRTQAYTRGMMSATFDPQALTVIIVFFGAAMLVVAAVVLRATSALKSVGRRNLMPEQASVPPHVPSNRNAFEARGQSEAVRSADVYAVAAPPSRAAALIGALMHTVRREQATAEALATSDGKPRAAGSHPTSSAANSESAGGVGGGIANRRLVGRRTRSAALRDRAR